MEWAKLFKGYLVFESLENIIQGFGGTGYALLLIAFVIFSGAWTIGTVCLCLVGWGYICLSAIEMVAAKKFKGLLLLSVVLALFAGFILAVAMHSYLLLVAVMVIGYFAGIIGGIMSLVEWLEIRRKKKARRRR